MNIIRRTFAQINALGYRLARPWLFRQNAQTAHENALEFLARTDASDTAVMLARIGRNLSQPTHRISIGGCILKNPYILAAGFVKGHGFTSEEDALHAVKQGVNIIPGWKTIPRLVGLVEFGSFTRYPRIGNPGTVIWRDAKTRSTQNRVGLKNPGAVAAAEFLQQHIIDLPHQFGINIAVSPGIDDDSTSQQHISESIAAFLKRGVVPNWFTLNISCPNTEDDPSGNQTEASTRHLCESALQQIDECGYSVPLWVKLSPGLAPQQYKILMRVFAETGVKAVIATNTHGQPAPSDAALSAGVGGGRLHPHALQTVDYLRAEKQQHDYPVDIVGCGGIIDGDSYLNYKARGIHVVQYWSALIYRGPLAAAIIESEIP
jgi:dihydroorotate dehydrogenase